MKLHITRRAPLTGDVRTVTVLNFMQIASFQMLNGCYSDSDMLAQTCWPKFYYSTRQRANRLRHAGPLKC